jgi:hypothetical protein
MKGEGVKGLWDKESTWDKKVYALLGQGRMPLPSVSLDFDKEVGDGHESTLKWTQLIFTVVHLIFNRRC